MKKYLILIMTILLCIVLAACAREVPAGEDDEEDDTHYAVEDMEIGTGIGSFNSIDLDGNEISDEIFSEKDVTVLNVWATFCDPCIEEMPELQKLAEELPDNAQMIGVVMDAPPQGADRDGEYDVWEGEPYNIQTAREICEETGVKYTNILASDSVFKAFKIVESVPTTFILDKSGNIVCKVFVGSNVQGYRKAVNDYLAGL
ncbi:MAG: redoxin domain-containing protein [Mogibacterium sp.]|nr:redoxin domain-containing protein [Mogibacterium sp.]